MRIKKKTKKTKKKRLSTGFDFLDKFDNNFTLIKTIIIYEL